jgi:hypothetical protein
MQKDSFLELSLRLTFDSSVEKRSSSSLSRFREQHMSIIAVFLQEDLRKVLSPSSSSSSWSLRLLFHELNQHRLHISRPGFVADIPSETMNDFLRVLLSVLFQSLRKTFCFSDINRTNILLETKRNETKEEQVNNRVRNGRRKRKRSYRRLFRGINV